MNPSSIGGPSRGLETDVIYPGPGRSNEQQPYVCESKRKPNQALRRSAQTGAPAPVSTLTVQFGPSRLAGRENRMAFMFKLEREDGTPADPPTLKAAVPDWHAGDTIPLGRDRVLRVVDIRLGREPDDDPVLVVETL
jgi:hypothetical protein